MSGAIGRYQSIYNPTDLGDTVGSYLLGSDGTEIDQTGGALNVHIASGADFDIRDLSHLQDSIKVGDGVEFLAINADGSINVGNTVDVSATDLDIRNLVFATDKVDVSGSSVTVTATDLDIRDLSHTQDSMKLGDGTDFLAIESDGSINVNSTASGYGSCAYKALSITNTATQLFATPLALRKSVLLQNRGNKAAFVGCDNSVTISNGIEVPAGGSVELNFGPAVDLHAITASGTADFRLIEAA